METTKKLYKVTLKGMTHNSTGVKYGINYVVANDSEEAYRKVRKFLDDGDMGFSSKRELDKIELLAENYQYTNTQYMLFL